VDAKAPGDAAGPRPVPFAKMDAKEKYRPPEYAQASLADVAAQVNRNVDDGYDVPALDPSSDFDLPIVRICTEKAKAAYMADPSIPDEAKRRFSRVNVMDGMHRLKGMLRWAKENGVDPSDVKVDVVTVDDPALMDRLYAPDDESPSAIKDHEEAIDEVHRRAQAASGRSGETP
jgi:hypothetical protein